MLKNRVIPCLLLKNDGLIKTRKYSKPSYVGDPINVVRIFNDKEVDEIIILDIDASKNNSGPNFKLIEDIASECFMPLCYGGGVRNFNDAKKLFNIGIEKVCLQSSVLSDYKLITQISAVYGSQSVVVSVDIKNSFFGTSKLFSSKNKKMLSKPWRAHLADIQDAGAGEVILSAVDLDGMMGGMNLELILEASELLEIPLIAIGGVGSLNHIKQAIVSGASAVAAGSFFIYQAPHRAVLITYPKYGELESLLMGNK